MSIYINPEYKFTQNNRTWLSLLVENNWIVKVHAYRKTNPSFIVDPGNVKKNIQRFPFGSFENLRKQGVFYEPIMDGHWYLFFLRDEVKDNLQIAYHDLSPAKCLYIDLCRKGVCIFRANGAKNKTKFSSFAAYKNGEEIGYFHHTPMNQMIDEGWFVEGEKEGDGVWLEFVDLRA